MQALILTQHVYQCALHLLHRHRDRTIPESPTSFSHPGLDCFRPVLQLSAFMLPRVRVLPTPHMLLIGPVDGRRLRKYMVDEFCELLTRRGADVCGFVLRNAGASGSGWPR